MKKHLFTLVLVLAFSLNATEAWSDNNSKGNDATASSNTYYINAPRFVRPLVERWINEYKQVNPNADFAIAKSADTKKNSSINITLQEQKPEEKAGKTVYFARYAILPITSRNSEAYAIFNQKPLNAKTLKKLFFVGDDVEEAENQDKHHAKVVVYAGNSSVSVSSPYASYYGEKEVNYRGKRIVGDDIYLNTAIVQDPKGITFNAISNVYDLQSRRLKSDLSVLPLDVSKDTKVSLSSLDNLITILEQRDVNGVAVEKIGFSYLENTTLDGFVAWVLSNGTGLNHEYGLLLLNDRDTRQESRKLGLLTAG